MAYSLGGARCSPLQAEQPCRYQAGSVVNTANRKKSVEVRPYRMPRNAESSGHLLVRVATRHQGENVLLSARRMVDAER